MNTGRKKIELKISFLVEQENHICVIRGKECADVKEFTFLLYEEDVKDILQDKDIFNAFHEYLDGSYYFYEFLIQHSLEYVHLNYIFFTFNEKNHVYFFATSDLYDNYWIDSGSYGEQWLLNSGDCYQSKFEINETNDEWIV